MRYKYSDPEFYRTFEVGEFITLTREHGNDAPVKSEPWIIGVVGQKWNPGEEEDVYLAADYTFHKGYSEGDTISIYDTPESACPYFEGWHHSTEDEIKIFEDALARTGHRINLENGEIEEIIPAKSITFNYHLLKEDIEFIEENEDC